MEHATLANVAARAISGATEAVHWEVVGPLRPTAVQILEVREQDQLWHVAVSENLRLWWKRYAVPTWKWPLTVLQRSRSQREACGLELLRERGLPAPRVCAHLEWHRHHMLRESALITHAIPGAMPLTHFLSAEQDPARRAAACRATGALAAQIHRVGVGHFRLLAKNVLIVPEDPARAWILDAPYLCAWGSRTPDAVRNFDLASLCSRAGELDALQREQVIAAYAEATGEAWQAQSLSDVARWRLRFRRVSLYLIAIWTGHRPERWIGRPPHTA